jgi:hypothetical protein
MKLPRVLFCFAVAIVVGMAVPWRTLAQTPPPPFNLALTINDGVSTTVYRGWPLVLRGDAVLMEEVAAPIMLGGASPVLAIASAHGTAAAWPLRRVSAIPSGTALGATSEAVRSLWLVTAEQTATLAPGAYSARLSWGGRSSPVVAFTLMDAPGTLPADDEIRRSLLQSEAAQLLGDTAGALAALVPAQARQPDSTDLLVQRARVHLQRGEPREAWQAAQRALVIFHRDDPRSSHPPVSILEVESAARTELFKNLPRRAPLPGSPNGGPHTVTSPAGVRGTISAPPLVSAGVTVGVSASAPVPPLPAPTAAPVGPPPGAVVSTAGLDDKKIRADAAGQWAASATASSQYSSPRYAPAQATGAPSVHLGMAGDNPDAWCPGRQNDGTEWLEVAFAKPAAATEVRVLQNNAPGAIAKVEAIEPNGTVHLWWEGKDPYVAPAIREIAWFVVRVPPTVYAVAKVKLTLNLAAVPGWKQIDAVQLVAAP